MNVPQLTPEELKTLQVFAYYCRSNGADDVYTTIYLSACSRDWKDDNWYSRQVRTSIESYDKIDDLIEKLVDDDSITNRFTECDGSQRIEVEIDCKERILNIHAYQTVYGSDPHGSDYTLEDIESKYTEEEYNAVVELFERLNGSNATVDFSGGGDDGYIEDFMIIDGNQVDIPGHIEDILNDMLSDYSGWENNEGAQGSWEFVSRDKTIVFDFNYNTEEEESVDLDYEIRF
tara:strand:+ start:537 stop:1232 length:696 start_codon:yes stop_codon:yes gene_type:complete